MQGIPKLLSEGHFILFYESESVALPFFLFSFFKGQVLVVKCNKDLLQDMEKS